MIKKEFICYFTKPLFLIVFCSIFFKQAESFSQENTSQEKELIYTSADLISGDLVTGEVSLKGNVKILFDNYELTAKEAVVSKKTFSLVASGGVRIEGNDSLIEAEEVEMNYKTRVGKIKNARITSGQLLLEAKEVVKINNEVFEARKGSFTTCNSCPPGWRIKAKKIKTNINKYIDLQGGRFQVLRTTILPLPRIVMPLNVRRKSGLIFPELTTVNGRLGLEVAQPYFWAINQQSDLTFSPKIYLNDTLLDDPDPLSFKAGLEYRHLFSSESRLNLNFNYMYDATYKDFVGAEDPFFRYAFSYENYFRLPKNVTQKTRLTLIRDRDYLTDFNFEIQGLNEPALSNSFIFNKNYDRSFVSAEALYNINLIKEDPEADNDDAIHKAPELNYSMIDRPLLGNFLFLKTSTVYTNFIRNSAGFDGVILSPTDTINDALPVAEREPKAIDDNSNQFDATKDLLRTGHRLRLNAELSAPFRLGKIFDLLPAVTYRDSYYRFNVNKNEALNNSSTDPYSDFAFSRYLEGSLSLRTELTKVYGKRIKHKIEPELTYRQGTPVDQSNHVFFETSGTNADLPYHRRNRPISDFDFFGSRHGVQFDYWDRFFQAEYAELSLTNILISKKYQDKVAYYDQPIYFNIRQGYDFKNAREATGSSKDPWSNFEGTLKLNFKSINSLSRFSHYHEANVTDFSTRTRLIYQPGRFVQLTYNSTNFVELDNSDSNRQETAGIGFGWEFSTLQVQGQVDYSITDENIQSWMAGFNYTPLGRCWDIRLRVFRVIRPNDNDQNPNIRLAINFNLGPDNEYKKTLLRVNSSIRSESDSGS